MEHKTDILSKSLDEIKRDLISMGEKSFRGEQIYEWLYKKGVTSFHEMTNLPQTLILKLESQYSIGTLRLLKRLISKDRHTIKYLYLLGDNNIIECVVMKYHHGNTLCLSTQVGCAMGCSFCASGAGGLVRNLSVGEMTAQLLKTDRDISELGWGRITGMVLMGSGEPLDNYDNTLEFLHQSHNPKGFNMGWRSITLSTCGMVPKIRLLADEGISINLAVSLHASNDEMRRRIMRIANVYSIKDVIEASRYYFEKTGRRVTFEYALIQDENDKPEHAEELAYILREFPCHVNLIPLNENMHSSSKRSRIQVINKFESVLKSAGISVTRRREMGLDIQGACGQLKASFLNGTADFKTEEAESSNGKYQRI